MVYMNRKQLTIYDFGTKILSEIENFDFDVQSIRPKYPDNSDKQNIMKLCFRWFWNDYDGYGEIDFDAKTNKVCNQIGENFSQMTVKSTSKRQAQKHVSELYNDRSLEGLFNYIISQSKQGNKENKIHET